MASHPPAPLPSHPPSVAPVEQPPSDHPISPPPPPAATTPPLPPPPPSPSSSISPSFIAGATIGGGAVLLVVAVLFVCWRWKKNKRRSRSPPPPPDSGRPPMPSPPKDNFYGVQSHGWKQSAPPDDNRVMPMPQYLPPPPTYTSRPPLPRPHFPSPPPPPPPPPQPTTNSGGSGSTYSSESPLPPPSPSLSLGFSKSTFTYEELLTATEGFSDSNLLGQGGFGYVHKGILSNGREVAVKQLKSDSGQGEREFQAEVEIISRVHHKQLVSLVGYCLTEDKMLLVYEFVPNRTLEFHLHGEGRPVMEWPQRMKIAVGSAKGLAYLHEDCHPRIIHRDIKAANILLDFKFEAKVADFGLARFSSDNNTHISTRVMGTFGYLAPEYAASGKLTDKSDVFSFGVMLLELITGRRPVDSTNAFLDDSLVDWARPLLARALDDGNYDALSDPRLQNKYDTEEMARMVACAAACVRHSARHRPRLSQIVHVLEGNVSLADLNEGVRPGHNSLFRSYGSSDYDISQYAEDMRNFRKLALTEPDYTNTEYSAATSERSHNPSGSSREGGHSLEHDNTDSKNENK